VVKQIDTILLVRNIEESKAFYTGTMNLEILHDWTSMVVFQNRLAIHQLDLLQPQDILRPFLDDKAIGAGNVIIYLATEDLTGEFKRLSALGVEIVHGIIDLPWQKVFRLRDNSGYLIEVGEEPTPPMNDEVANTISTNSSRANVTGQREESPTGGSGPAL